MCRMQALITFLLLLFLPVAGNAAETGRVEELYTAEFWQGAADAPNSPSPQKLAYLDGVLYTVHDGNRLYAWQVDAAQPPTLYCQLPPLAVWGKDWMTTGLDALPPEDRDLLVNEVDFLFAADGALWGYNFYSGRIGTVSQAGVAWREQALDHSVFYPLKDESIFLTGLPEKALIDAGTLYMYAGFDSVHGPYPYAMLRFDLETGDYTAFDAQNGIQCCPYTPGNVLLMRLGDGGNVTLSRMRLADGAIEDLSIDVPFTGAFGVKSVGGLAYDAARDRIFLSAQGQVWVSEAGGALTAVATLPQEATVMIDTPALMLSENRYVIRPNGVRLYVCTVDP